MSERSLFRQAAFDFVRTYERWERMQARGRSDEADAEYEVLQLMDDGLVLTERHTAWRSALADRKLARAAR